MGIEAFGLDRKLTSGLFLAGTVSTMKQMNFCVSRNARTSDDVSKSITLQERV